MRRVSAFGGTMIGLGAIMATLLGVKIVKDPPDWLIDLLIDSVSETTPESKQEMRLRKSAELSLFLEKNPDWHSSALLKGNEAKLEKHRAYWLSILKKKREAEEAVATKRESEEAVATNFSQN